MKLSHEFSAERGKKKKGIALEVPVWSDRFIFGGGSAQRVGRVEGKESLTTGPPEGWSRLGVLPL